MNRWFGGLLLVLLASILVPIGKAAADDYPETLVSPEVSESDGLVRVNGFVKAISDDGNLVLWQSSTIGTFEVTSLITDRAAGTTSVVAKTPVLVNDMSGDGRYLLRERHEERGGWTDFVVERHDRSTGRTIELLRGSEWSQTVRAEAVELSPDGRYALAWVSEIPLWSQGVRIDIATGRRSTIDEAAHLNLSADGRYAVYAVWDGGVGSRVYRRDFATGVDRYITDGDLVSAQLALAISSNGRFVVVNGELYDLTTGGVVPFVDHIVRDIAVSADGDRVVFDTWTSLSAEDRNGTPDFYVWSRSEGRHWRVSLTDRGTELKRTDRSGSVVMTPDGTFIAYSTEGANASDRVYGQYGGNVPMVVNVDEVPADIGVVDVASSPSGGLLTVYRTGEVEPLGGAQTFTDCNRLHPDGYRYSRPSLRSGEEVTSISSTPTGDGYWLYTNFGKVIACGGAEFFGDLSELALAGPIVDSVATVTGNGYYMVGADGGLFAFGDAAYRGSVPEVLPGVRLAAPIVAITVTESNQGYRMVAADGGMFNFGDARFFGSIPQVLPGVALSGPVIDMVASPTGYLIVGDDGGIFNFGSSPFHGSLGGQSIPERIRTVVVVDDLSGYVMFDRNGDPYPFGTGQDLLS